MVQRHIKLPNNRIVAVDENGFIQVKVEVDLSEFIDNDFEGVLDLLSRKATGTEVLGNICYGIVCHRGNTLEVLVGGDIDLIDAEEIDFESLPPLEFEVQVTRIGYSCRTVRLSARTMQEAINKADADAGDHVYSEHQADYVLEASRLST